MNESRFGRGRRRQPCIHNVITSTAGQEFFLKKTATRPHHRQAAQGGAVEAMCARQPGPKKREEFSYRQLYPHPPQRKAVKSPRLRVRRSFLCCSPLRSIPRSSTARSAASAHARAHRECHLADLHRISRALSREDIEYIILRKHFTSESG
jgi:hypothetical protein